MEEAAVAVEVAERADGVPDANEMHRAGAGVLPAVGGGLLLVVLPGVQTQGLADAVFLPRMQQAAFVQHVGEGAHGIRSAGEAEQVYAVAGAIPLHQEAVAVLDIGGAAVAEQLAQGGADDVLAAEVEQREGAHAGLVGKDLLVLAANRFGAFWLARTGTVSRYPAQQVDDVVVDLAFLVGGAVAAEDDVPFHGTLRVVPSGAIVVWLRLGRAGAWEMSRVSKMTREGKGVRGKLLFVANDAGFFVSHRLAVGLGARDAEFAVYVAAPGEPPAELGVPDRIGCGNSWMR